MHSLPKLVPVGLLIALSACAAPINEFTDAQREEIAAAVRAQYDSFFDACAAVEFDAIMQHLENSTDVSWTYAGNTYSSWQDIDAAFRPGFEALSGQEFQMDDPLIDVLSPDLVYTLTRGSGIQTDKEGMVGDPIEFAWGALWERQDGTWKIIHGFQSDVTIETR